MRDVRCQKAPENTTMIADLEVEQFMDDDVVLEGTRLLEQIGGEGTPPPSRAGCPLARHALEPDLCRRDANAVRPAVHPPSEIVSGRVSHVRSESTRSPI